MAGVAFLLSVCLSELSWVGFASKDGRVPFCSIVSTNLRAQNSNRHWEESLAGGCQNSMWLLLEFKAWPVLSPHCCVWVCSRVQTFLPTLSAGPSVPFSYGESDHSQEMGSGFVGAPTAPQGPPKQVAGGEITGNEGSEVREGCGIDKPNKRGCWF